MQQQIMTAFVKAQKAFAPALKTSTNPHYRSRYADLAACVEAVIDALNANGIALIQKTHDSENGVAVETLLIHESGEHISGGILHVPASKRDPQGYGSALTYARRYSLMATCGIAPEDDDGNSSSKPDKAEEIEAAKKLIRSCQTLNDLQRKWISLSPDTQKAIVSVKDEVKAALMEVQGDE